MDFSGFQRVERRHYGGSLAKKQAARDRLTATHRMPIVSRTSGEPDEAQSGEREAGKRAMAHESGAAPATVIELNRSPWFRVSNQSHCEPNAQWFAGRRYGEDQNPLVSPETGLLYTRTARRALVRGSPASRPSSRNAPQQATTSARAGGTHWSDT